MLANWKSKSPRTELNQCLASMQEETSSVYSGMMMMVEDKNSVISQDTRIMSKLVVVEKWWMVRVVAGAAGQWG